VLGRVKELLEMKTLHNNIWFDCLNDYWYLLETADSDVLPLLQGKWARKRALEATIKEISEELDNDDNMRFLTNSMADKLDADNHIQKKND
jgi:hypothetical protein